MKPNEEGIFVGEPEEVYHADKVYQTPALSASLAKLLIDATPRHCFSASERMNPKFARKDTDRFDRGKVVHAWTLRSDSAVIEAPYDSWRTKESQTFKTLARSTGKVPVLTADYQELKEMVAEQRYQLDGLDGGNPFASGDPEVVIRWREDFVWHGKPRSIWCRARLDNLNVEFDNAYDLKSTQASARPEDWTRKTMWGIGAPYQACHYRRGLRRLTQLGILKMHDPDFIFIVAESEAPFCLSAINVPSSIRQWGSEKTADEKLIEAYALWADCLESGEWPGYSPEIHVAEGARTQGARPEPSTAGASPHLDSQDVPDSGYETVGQMIAKRKSNVAPS